MSSSHVKCGGRLLFLGIDLAATERRPSGYCVLSACSMSCDAGLLRFDEEVINLALSLKPKVVAVDSPLSMPKGGGAFRFCDLEARRRGFKVLPLSLPGMLRLARRGIKLGEALRDVGCDVIEVFPTGAFVALGIASPKKDFEGSLKGLLRLGLRLGNVRSIHELDAAMSAYVAYKYFKGEVELIGDKCEGFIVLPKA
ncbi:MAG: DUF429 domain-containing protein [Candidatus Nezhaarchaeota archaeon]|nr:DUF429 domain-containing protein [Candidatus Nezhaarchaeota archaeon]